MIPSSADRATYDKIVASGTRALQAWRQPIRHGAKTETRESMGSSMVDEMIKEVTPEVTWRDH